MNLIVGDYLKLKNHYVDTVAAGIQVIKWFNNHSVARGLFRKTQKDQKTGALALILPCLTRWTTHFLACSRLLSQRLILQACVLLNRDKLLMAAGEKAEAKETAEEVLTIVEDRAGTFWPTLAKYVAGTCPFSFVFHTDSYLGSAPILALSLRRQM